MALGAAIAGLAGGYAKGVQIKSDLEDAKENRGLKALQKQQAELELDRNKQMADLSKQIGDKVMNFAPQSLDDVDAFDSHYGQLEGLLVKQAAIAGKDPLAVKSQMDSLRREKYAERVYAATRMFETGNDAGFEILKPVYNRLFKDGNMLMGGTFNRADDTYDIRYMAPGGEEKTVSVGREALVKQWLPMGLNTGDALKLALKDIETQESRRFETQRDATKMDFEGVQTDKKLGVKVGIAAADRASQERIAGARTTASTQERETGRDDTALTRFDSNLAGALGYDPKYATEKSRQRFEKDAVPATSIFKATNDIARVRLTANEAVSVLKAVREGSADVRPIPGRPGFMAVQAGTTRAVVPAGMIEVEK